MALVHGDDFVSVGTREAAGQFQSQLKARFEIKTQVIGAPNLDNSARASPGLGGGSCRPVRARRSSVKQGRQMDP